MIDIRPVRSVDDLKSIAACAEDDGHVIINPTQYILKDDVLVGSLSIMPAVVVWMDSKKTKIRDALEVRTFYEGHLASGGNNTILVPCMESSPFYPILQNERLKYVPLEHKLFIKGL